MALEQRSLAIDHVLGARRPRRMALASVLLAAALLGYILVVVMERVLRLPAWAAVGSAPLLLAIAAGASATCTP